MNERSACTVGVTKYTKYINNILTNQNEKCIMIKVLITEGGILVKNPIITISREFGSGGREAGTIVAQKLNIPYYDNALITIAAKKSGFVEELFEQADQKPTGSLLYSLSMFGAGMSSLELPLNDKIFLIQSDIIKEVAAQGPCVIVGRCADYVLRDTQNVVNFFLYGDLEARTAFAVKERDLPSAKAAEAVAKYDKRRASYYHYYTGKKWGEAKNYHLCMDTTHLTPEKTAEVILQYVSLL